jgi:hypothetical protein
MFINKANNNNTMKKYLIIIILITVAVTSAYGQTKGHDMSGMHMDHATKKTVKPAPKKVTVKKPASKSAAKEKVATQPAKSSAPTHNMDDMKGMDMSSGEQKKDSTHTSHMNEMHTMHMGNNHTKDTTQKGAHNMGNMDHSNMSGRDNKDDTSKKRIQGMGNMNMHDHSNMNHDTIGMHDHSNVNHDTMGMHDHMHMETMGGMNHAFSLNLPMNRNGSGTGWLPDASPMYGYMFHKKKWMYMLHGNLFLRYNSQDFTNKGSRGASKFDAPDWVMFMGQRQVGKSGLFHFNTMFSLDAAIAGGSGYPLLFQSGEAYKGKSIVDRQHPHDLFSELSVSYSQALSKKADVFAYVGYPGEPAIGPVAFMHRPSALDNPDAPISHHWVDATHITFGVATLGLRYGNFKLEGSSFTGREPDENRYDFDKPLFNSWSGRLSYNPTKNWALQVSHGFIKSPEALHTDEDINRTSASAIYSTELKDNSTINATAIWGMNKSKGHDGENAFLLEGSWRKNKLALHARYEWVQKSTEELSLDEAAYGHHIVFPVNAFTAGFNYDLLKFRNTRLAGGSQFTLYHADEKLNSLYGKNPMAVEVYLRLYPGRMRM